jgi:hypothetical protein
MMILTTSKSVYYPLLGLPVDLIRGSKRVRYVRGSLTVNAKSLKTR